MAAVVLFHAGHLRGGYLGVDLFFVLSGFLITSLLFVEYGNAGRVGLGHFWARRARRLLPALGGLLIGVAAYCAFLAQPAELAQIRGDALATIAYVANWRAVFTDQDYWALFRAPSPLNHTWSLAIEEQFYLVWPLVFVGVLAWWRERFASVLLIGCLFLAALSYTLMGLLYAGGDPSRVYFGTDTRAGSVLLGGALAAAFRVWGTERRRGGRLVLEGAGIAGAVALAVTWSTVDGQTSALYRGGFFLVGVAATLVIAASVQPDRLVLGRLLSWRPLCWLGLVSYGVYLWHWPVDVVLTERRVGVGGWVLFAAQFGVTLVIAVASYFLLERPIRRGAGTKRQWCAAVPALAGVLMLGVVVSTARASGPPGESAIRSQIDRAVANAAELGPRTRRVMVIGDSVGVHAGAALAKVPTSAPMVVANTSLLACVMPSGASAVTYTTPHETRPNPPSCDAHWSDALTRLHPDTVVMFAWAEGNMTLEFDGRERRPCDAAWKYRLRDDLVHVARRVQTAGARFVITTYPPTTEDTRTAAARRGVACINAVRRAVARATGSQLADLARHVCPKPDACMTEVDGFPLRPDGVHFKGVGGQVVATWIASQIWPTGSPARPG